MSENDDSNNIIRGAVVVIIILTIYLLFKNTESFKGQLFGFYSNKDKQCPYSEWRGDLYSDDSSQQCYNSTPSILVDNDNNYGLPVWPKISGLPVAHNQPSGQCLSVGASDTIKIVGSPLSPAPANDQIPARLYTVDEVSQIKSESEKIQEMPVNEQASEKETFVPGFGSATGVVSETINKLMPGMRQKKYMEHKMYHEETGKKSCGRDFNFFIILLIVLLIILAVSNRK